MKPNEFPWDESQQVTVVNPTGEDFRFKAHNKEYMVKAGQTVKMAGWIGWLYVYGLACKMAQEADDFIHWNEEGFRQKYYEKLIKGTDQVLQEVVVEPEPAFETFDDIDEDEDEDEDESNKTEPESEDSEEPTETKERPVAKRRGRRSKQS